MDQKPEIWIEVMNNPELADRLEPFRQRLEMDGYKVEIRQLGVAGLTPIEIVGWVVEIGVATAISNEVYPKLRQFLKEWFTEVPTKEREPLRARVVRVSRGKEHLSVHFFDQDDTSVEEMRLDKHLRS